MSANPHMRALSALARRFRDDQRGGSLILFGLTIPVLVGIAGVAIDYSRAVNVQNRVQTATDAAALASVAYLRNGGSTTAAAALAQNVFLANFNGGSATLQPPAFNVAGTQYTASLNAQGTVNTTLGNVLGFSSLPANAASQATALSGPSGGGSMAMNASGSGAIWGDPHLVYTPTGGTTTTANLTCSGGSWYNILSDAGMQWNSYCQKDGTSLYFGGSTIQVGTHTISYISAFPDAGPNGNDTFPNDCITVSSLAGTGICGWAFPAMLVIDGQTIDPTSAQFAGMSTFTALNDTTQGITVTVQMSNNAIPAVNFPSVPAGAFNYLAVDVKTATYEALITLPANYQDFYATVNNAGMCGSPGGYFGAAIAGGTTTDMSPYLVPGPTYQGGQFVWTPVCGNNGGQIAHLSK